MCSFDVFDCERDGEFVPGSIWYEGLYFEPAVPDNTNTVSSNATITAAERKPATAKPGLQRIDLYLFADEIKSNPVFPNERQRYENI